MASIVKAGTTAIDSLLVNGQSLIDGAIPPKRRADLWQKLQAFAAQNPTLSAFLLSHVILSGLPILMFLTFVVSVFVSSLLAVLFFSLLTAFVVTTFAVGVALLILVPTLFVTTIGATFVFFWGLGGYYLFTWFTNDQMERSDRPAPSGRIENHSNGKMDTMADTKLQANPARYSHPLNKFDAGTENQTFEESLAKDIDKHDINGNPNLSTQTWQNFISEAA